MSRVESESVGSHDVLSEQGKRAAALRLLRQALQLLDEANAPPELGARLDEVITRVERSIHLGVRRS